MTLSRFRTLCTLTALALSGSPGLAQVGLTELPGMPGDGPVTVFYPSSSPATSVRRGIFNLQVANGGAALRGNGRLIVISHGSGSAPWVQSDLAQHLVRAGYIVALPEHAGDNSRDMGKVGPESWKQRPQEVSRAIDVLSRDARFGPLFDASRVGVHGMSAGGPLDGLKKAIALPLIRWNLSGDPASYGHTDPRTKAVISAVPFAADFDPQTLTNPVAPLGLIQAQQDRWLVPRFHSAAVIAQCTTCETIADMPQAGHGALLAPLPPDLQGRVGRLVADPPGFQRSDLPALYQRIEAFFNKHLLP